MLIGMEGRTTVGSEGISGSLMQCRSQGGGMRQSRPVWQGCSGLLQCALLCSAKKGGEADECFRLLSFPPLSRAVRRMPLGIILMKLWPFDHAVASVIADASPPKCITYLFPAKMSQAAHYQTCTHSG